MKKTLAEMVGFEPTERFTVQTISSRSRYDHFDTSPYLTMLLYHIPEKKSSVYGKFIIFYRNSTYFTGLFRNNML